MDGVFIAVRQVWGFVRREWLWVQQPNMQDRTASVQSRVQKSVVHGFARKSPEFKTDVRREGRPHVRKHP